MNAGLDFLLPDQDSNLDKLNQNQLYYHYTIGQSIASFLLRKHLSQTVCKYKAIFKMRKIFFVFF